MLNDIARQTRLAVFTQMSGSSLMIGSVFAISEEAWRLCIALFVTGLVVLIGWVVGFIAWTRRADRQLRARVATGSIDLVSGRVAGIPASGRVVRSRPAARSPSFVDGTPNELAGPARVVVVTALVEDGARRVAALVPATIGGQMRSQHAAALLLHPTDADVAVLDPRVTREQIDAIAADPRWRTRLPSDRTVVGGYAGLLAAAGLGLGAGLGFDWLVVALAT